MHFTVTSFVYRRYHDGYIATDLDKTTINMQKIFYPKFWLDLTGFWDSKINTGPDVILFASRDTERAAHSSSGSGLIDGTAYIRSNSPAVHLSFASFVMLLLVTVTLSVMGGVYFARKQQKRVFLWEAVTAAHEYIQINNSVDSVRL